MWNCTLHLYAQSQHRAAGEPWDPGMVFAVPCHPLPCPGLVSEQEEKAAAVVVYAGVRRQCMQKQKCGQSTMGFSMQQLPAHSPSSPESLDAVCFPMHGHSCVAFACSHDKEA